MNRRPDGELSGKPSGLRARKAGLDGARLTLGTRTCRDLGASGEPQDKEQDAEDAAEGHQGQRIGEDLAGAAHLGGVLRFDALRRRGQLLDDFEVLV